MARMASPDQPETQPKNRLAYFGYLAAFFLTLYGLLLNNVTFATNDYTAIVVQALAASIVASLLFVICWLRMPTSRRVVSVFLLLANAWTIMDAGFRRLPYCLDWV
jgi:uncharacterized membrane protein YdcZ (DUF606 family)